MLFLSLLEPELTNKRDGSTLDLEIEFESFMLRDEQFTSKCFRYGKTIHLLFYKLDMSVYKYLNISLSHFLLKKKIDNWTLTIHTI